MLRRDLITVSLYLKGGHKDKREMPQEAMWRRQEVMNASCTRKSFISIQEIIFCSGSNIHYNNLARGMVGSPLLEVFKMQLDKVLDDLI